MRGIIERLSVVGAVMLMTVGLAALGVAPSDATADDEPLNTNKCTPNTNNICAECSTTGGIFFCLPNMMAAPGFSYGSCVEFDDEPGCTERRFDCGPDTYYCSNGSIILGAANCVRNVPVCKTHL